MFGFVRNIFDFLGPTWFYVVLGILLLVLVAIVARFWDTLVWALEWGKITFGWAWNIFMWAFPPIIVWVAYKMNSLHVSVFEIPESAFGAMLVLGIIGLLWFVAQMLKAGSPRARLIELALDFLVACFWTGVLLFACGIEVGRDRLQLWLAAPLVFLLLDLVVNTVVALRNAWQRDPTQFQPDS